MTARGSRWAAALLGALAASAPVMAGADGPLPVAAEAPAETVRVELAGPAGAPSPLAMRVAPDTVAMGGTVWIALDFPPGSAAPRPEQITASGRDLLLEPADADAAPVLLSAAAGGRQRRLVSARMHALGPVRLAWQGSPGGPAAVAVVKPRLPADAGPAPLRRLVGLGWRWERLAALALLAALVLAVAARRGRRKQVGAADAALAPPAYLSAALALEELRALELPRKGEGRRFLDRLAGVGRVYLRNRFGLPAAEMTPAEIERKLRARGHAGEDAERWRDLLDACDARRYAPGQASAGDCDCLLAATVALMDVSRVPARFTPVPADLAVRGEMAWGRLRDLIWAHPNAAAPAGLAQGGRRV